MSPHRARPAVRSPIVYACERCLRINASADTVWNWLADVRRILSVNSARAVATVRHRTGSRRLMAPAARVDIHSWRKFLICET